MTETVESPDFTPDNLEAAGALTPTFDPGYSWPEDPKVAENLENWRDLKLGVIIHWGIYTTIGQAGSWSLHRDRLGDFTDPPADFEGSLANYHRWYYQQRHRFDASDFDAQDWAKRCAEAGMKYVVFTTKHHDGFALYDTKYSNLKVTAEDVPADGRDIFREVTDAFRAQNMETGVYFSKADWAHPCYWDLAQPLHDRFHNYSIEDQPKRWDRFVQFTHDQIEELLTDYGPMNVLWLDAGWVRDPEEPIDIDGIADVARKCQPGILVVDREVHGPHENYRTPEQGIPDTYLDFPWEACVTWTRSWCSQEKDEPAKPTSEIVRNLLRIVARGGNYLVGFGPDSTGALSVNLMKGLKQLGAWMDVNGEGIYGTRAIAEPPTIEAGEGDYEWHIVTKGDDYYLYAIPESGVCKDGSVRIDLPVKSAQILGEGAVDATTENNQTLLQVKVSEQPYGLVIKLEV